MISFSIGITERKKVFEGATTPFCAYLSIILKLSWSFIQWQEGRFASYEYCESEDGKGPIIGLVLRRWGAEKKWNSFKVKPREKHLIPKIWVLLLFFRKHLLSIIAFTGWTHMIWIALTLPLHGSSVRCWMLEIDQNRVPLASQASTISITPSRYSPKL